MGGKHVTDKEWAVVMALVQLAVEQGRIVTSNAVDDVLKAVAEAREERENGPSYDALSGARRA